jgi:hypothetical protein
LRVKVDHAALGLIGISTNIGTLIPTGNYLRWTLGRRLDVPLLVDKVTFSLSRRPHRPPSAAHPLSLSAATVDPADPTRARLGPIDLAADRSFLITPKGLESSAPLTVTATFAEPVVAVSVERLRRIVHPVATIRAALAPELFPLADRVQWLPRRGETSERDAPRRRVPGLHARSSCRLYSLGLAAQSCP